MISLRSFIKVLTFAMSLLFCMLIFFLQASPIFANSSSMLGLPPVFPDKAPAELKFPAMQPLAATPSVDPSDRNASRNYYLTYYEGAPKPSVGWTGNVASCSEGTTAAGFKDAVATRINYFRAMAGMPSMISLLQTYNHKNQKTALMMSAKGDLDHDPDTSWPCYSADGKEGANNSNLALFNYGWNAITSYMRDSGDNNGAVGHRRWILYPQTQNMGTGDIPTQGSPSTNALWVFDSNIWGARPPTRHTFVAWPPPGYVPYQVVFARWSFAYPGADFSGTTVTVTRNGQSIPVTIETYHGGYGENTLVWRLNGMSSGSYWPKPTSDESYAVSVKNVMVSGNPTMYNYTVNIFDPAQTQVCTYAIDPTEFECPPIVCRSKPLVTAPPGCDWTAVENHDWISLLGQQGTGDGTFLVTVGENKTFQARVGTITVEDKVLTIRQKGRTKPTPFSLPWLLFLLEEK